jgi:excisionase family DNA binding protein
MTERLIAIPFGSEVLLLTEAEVLQAAQRGREFVRPVAEAAPAAVTPDEPLLNAQEMATATNLPKSWIYQLAKGGKIPCIRTGKHVRFVRSAVIAALAARGTQQAGTIRQLVSHR